MLKFRILIFSIYVVLLSNVGCLFIYAQVTQGASFLDPYVGRWVLPTEGYFSGKVLEIASGGTVLEQITVVIGVDEQQRLASRVRSRSPTALRRLSGNESRPEVRCSFAYRGHTQGVMATPAALSQQGRSQFQWQLPIVVTDVRLGDTPQLSAFEQAICQRRLIFEMQQVARRGGLNHTLFFSRLSPEFLEDALTTRRFIRQSTVVNTP